MQTRTIIAAAGAGLATCAGLVFAVYQAQGRHMSDGVETLILFALFGGGLVFAFILAAAAIHGGAQVLHWAIEHIRFQNQWPIRYRRSGEPSKPPIVNRVTGVDLLGLVPTVVDPYFAINMVVSNHTGQAQTRKAEVTGLVNCAGQPCNDPPRMLAPIQMGPSTWDQHSCGIRQRVTREMAERIRTLLADGDSVMFDLGSVRIDGSYLSEQYIVVRGPLNVISGSDEMADMIRWSPVLASQHYYD